MDRITSEEFLVSYIFKIILKPNAEWLYSLFLKYYGSG
jgi:hypothetical protein